MLQINENSWVNGNNPKGERQKNLTSLLAVVLQTTFTLKTGSLKEGTEHLSSLSK